MLEPELTVLKEVGVAGAAFILVYILLKIMVQRSFVQSDALLDMAKGIIEKNTIAMQKVQDSLGQMQEVLIQHMQKVDKVTETTQERTETIVTKMQECKKNRDVQLKEILRKQ